MTDRLQHLQDLGKSVTTLASILLAALVGFVSSLGPGKLKWCATDALFTIVYLALIVTITSSLVSMHLLSNQLVKYPSVGPRSMFTAAGVALYSFITAMICLGSIGIGEFLAK